MRTVVLYARSAQWREVIERAAALIEGPDFTALKSEGRTVAGFLEVPALGVAFLKRAQSASTLDGIVDRMRGSRAARALKGAALLGAAQLGCAEPIAAADERGGGAVRASYLLTEPLTGDTLSRFALGPGGIRGRDLKRKRRILATVAREVRRLHDAGLYTRDLQETNLMVDDDGAGGFSVNFLDLEDVRRARRVSERRRLRNLIHLDRSIGRFLTRASRLRFLYTYMGERPDKAVRRGVVKELLSRRGAIDRRRTAPAPPATSEAAPVAAAAAHATGALDAPPDASRTRA
jgi:Lipopolysaccharide kinase (Kdo/WaaP) family